MTEASSVGPRPPGLPPPRAPPPSHACSLSHASPAPEHRGSPRPHPAATLRWLKITRFVGTRPPEVATPVPRRHLTLAHSPTLRLRPNTRSRHAPTRRNFTLTHSFAGR